MDRQCPDGDVVDVDMHDTDSDTGHEFAEDDEEHEELGGIDFELEMVDPVPEEADAEALEPMDIDEDEEQDPEPKTESEAMSSEEESEQSKSSSKLSSSDPDWVP
ncbi:hypothetical protein NL676_008665 [Syzygium grande]|nr:hypothetical protein NL676_008665 [Syzygium grande]